MGSECGVRIEDRLRIVLAVLVCVFIKSVTYRLSTAQWQSVVAFIDFAFPEHVGNQMKTSKVETAMSVSTMHPRRQEFRLPPSFVFRCLCAILYSLAARLCET